MQTQTRRFPAIKPTQVFPDRHPCAVGEGRLSVIGFPTPGFGPINAQSRTVVAHHERGELDGATEVDGG